MRTTTIAILALIAASTAKADEIPTMAATYQHLKLVVSDQKSLFLFSVKELAVVAATEEIRDANCANKPLAKEDLDALAESAYLRMFDSDLGVEEFILAYRPAFLTQNWRECEELRVRVSATPSRQSLEIVASDMLQDVLATTVYRRDLLHKIGTAAARTD